MHMGDRIATFVDDGQGLGENGKYRTGNADLEVIVNELKKWKEFRPLNELFERKWMKNG